MTKKRLNLPLLALQIFCIALTVFLAYKWQRIFFNECIGDTFSDVPLHTQFALDHQDYSLSAYLIRFLYSLGDAHFAQTALSLCMAVNHVVGVGTVWWLLRTMFPKLNGWVLFLASLLAHLCGPWIIEGYQTALYHTAYNGNIFHNMTVLFSRTFIPICFIFFFKCWDARHERIHFWTWLVFALSVLIATLFKPNFAFAFIPMLGLLLIFDLIKYKGQFIKNDVILGCAVLPSGLVMIWQYFILFSGDFYGGPSSVAIVLGISGAELLALIIMYIRCLLLPIYTYSLQAPKEESWGHIKLILFVEAIALLEANIIVETGSRAGHGNYLWGALAMYPIIFALGITLLFRMIQEIQWKKAPSVAKCAVGVIMLGGHLAIGILFMYLIGLCWVYLM